MDANETANEVFNILSTVKTNGLYVKNILKNSRAYNAGVKNGDFIVSIDDIPITGFDSYLSSTSGKSSYVAGIIRNQTYIEITI